MPIPQMHPVKVPIPQMQPVESSAVARIGYDAELEMAFVEYLGGDLYAYEGVPAEVFEALADAESKGTFVNATIKEYPFRRL
ncbi:MAG TPA: KTSC domain-containing protein [Solirubrobacterales bacterium]|nr:KTSC domain-containing protein [Solirubrobacterales bacterium]